MRATTGSAAAIDWCPATQMFNVAALLGNQEAIRLRREIAADVEGGDHDGRSEPRVMDNQALGRSSQERRPALRIVSLPHDF